MAWEASCSLYVPAHMRCMFADTFTCFAGELPKELGKLAKLTYFDVSGNSIGGELYVPYYISRQMHMTGFCV